MTLPAEGTGRSTQQPLLPLPGAVYKSPASQGCSPVPGLSLGWSSRGCGWEPPSQVWEDTGLQRRVPDLGSLHVLLQLLLVKGLEPADHGLVDGLQSFDVQLAQQHQDGRQDVVLGTQRVTD